MKEEHVCSPYRHEEFRNEAVFSRKCYCACGALLWSFSGDPSHNIKVLAPGQLKP